MENNHVPLHSTKPPVADNDNDVKRRLNSPKEPTSKRAKPRDALSPIDNLEDSGSDSENDEIILRRILAEAAARGIPLDFLAHSGMHDEEDDDDVEFPFDTPPQSLQDVAEFIESDKCRKIVILAGAGMSVASGIPDFRSSNGLYATLDPDRLTVDERHKDMIRIDPSFCLDQHLFLENPLPCLEVNREFILGVRDRKWKATLAHRFVELLRTQTGKLCRLYTQNIDGLEDQCSGLPHSERIAVHGSMDEATCAVCNHQMPFSEFCEKVERQIKDITGRDPNAPKESTAIVCESCGARSVKPNIVLFRSSLPKEFFHQVPADTKDADLLIVMGTSLHVAPANSLVWRVPRSAMRVLLNRESVGWHLGMDFDKDRDFFGQGNCENVVLDLMTHLGWLDKLKPLLGESGLPAASAALLQQRLDSLSSSSTSSESTEEKGEVSSSDDDSDEEQIRSNEGDTGLVS